ncbi:Cationic amino acid transporter 2, partial [Lambiella insularis]|nr:Cationic amino acid transporter 2 [Lambiella insularis]
MPPTYPVILSDSLNMIDSTDNSNDIILPVSSRSSPSVWQILIMVSKAIGFSGLIRIGLFVTSGEMIGLSGSAGTVMSFAVAGLVIVAVMRTLAELVSVRPLSGAIIDFPHTYVDPALGFAVGMMYWLAQSLCMATLTSAAARIANDFLPDGEILAPGQKAGIVVKLFLITLFSNALGVK